MAVVGKGFAVLQSGKVQVSGIRGLAYVGSRAPPSFWRTSSLRLTVFSNGFGTYVTGQRGDRLIVQHHASRRGRRHVTRSSKALL